jgi:hypothetical protein
MAFKAEPEFEKGGYLAAAGAYPMNRARLKRLFRLTAKCAEIAFDNGETDLDILAEHIERKARYEKSILITIAVAVALELIKIWLRRLFSEYQAGKS